MYYIYIVIHRMIQYRVLAFLYFHIMCCDYGELTDYSQMLCSTNEITKIRKSHNADIDYVVTRLWQTQHDWFRLTVACCFRETIGDS